MFWMHMFRVCGGSDLVHQIGPKRKIELLSLELRKPAQYSFVEDPIIRPLDSTSAPPIRLPPVAESTKRTVA